MIFLLIFERRKISRESGRGENELTNLHTCVEKSGVLQCSISDHSLIFLRRRAKKLRSPGKNIQYRNFKRYSSENFAADLREASWEKVDTSLTVDEA